MEKIIDKGDQRLRVVEISMLEHDQLPRNYTGVGESVSLNDNSYNPYVKYQREFDNDFDIFWLRVSIDYSPEEIQEKIETIRRCGRRLAEINRLLAIKNAGWSGTETITI